MSRQPERAPLTAKAHAMRALILMALAEVSAVAALLIITGVL